ncbi:hypothetical protein [Cryptosporangium sp. NPDC048952]|uniref:hypothetical protein n=1 Tax=Cryptosporangium sp. NPDC048952 TaxID=3363961 RepID=UPI0037147165
MVLVRRSLMFSHFFDDAALFPPGDAPMESAVPAHRALVARYGDLVGPFVVPAARLEQLAAQVTGDPPFGVSVIAAPLDLPDALARVRAHPVLALRAVEVPLIDDIAAGVSELAEILPREIPVAVEIPRSVAREGVLDALASAGYRAKLRTGGLESAAFPPSEELAASIAACVTRGVPFKCTAGLHHAVRHTDPETGFTHHGFVNILVAVDALESGTAVEWLEEMDASRLVAVVKGWSAERVGRARAAFTSFGTCSVTEPIDDLIALGLLEGVRS